MTVVEKMAVSMCVASGRNPYNVCDIFVPGDPHAGYAWAGYRVLARAALTTLHDSFADPVVRAAIQAALDE